MPPETEAESEKDFEKAEENVEETSDAEEEKVEQPVEQPVEEEEYVGKKRHVSIFCPVCGMLCKARRYQVDHVFPNIMETFYEGYKKIRREYLVDGDPAIPALQNVVIQKVVKVVMEELSYENKKALLAELQAEIEVNEELPPLFEKDEEDDDEEDDDENI